jgi:CPA1 family monovalent cation:H+ antiporter
MRKNIRPIALLAVGLPLATTFAVGFVAYYTVPQLTAAGALALGAIVAPPDAVSASSIGRRLGLPRQIMTLLGGESLLNDATALVAYRIAIKAATGTVAFSLLDASWEFLWKAAGGIALGLVVGWVIAQIRKRLDDPLAENTIGLLSGYAAYVPAEQLHLSAVLSAVTVGCYVGWQAPKIASPATRLQGFGMWELLVFLMNAFLFVLMGLQLPVIVNALDTTDWPTLLGYGAAVSAAVVVTRLVWQHTIVFITRTLDRRESVRARRGTWQARMVVGWAGMRGAVSLAAALALPPGFPQRDLIVFLTFSVIFVTLVLQGLTLPPLIRWLGVVDDGTDEAREDLKARLVATKAALARIDELLEEEWTRNETLERMRGMYEYRKRRLAARTGKVDAEEDFEDRSLTYQTMVREVLEAQRREIVRLRNEGTISNDVMHRIERELDLEDERLEI